MEDAREPRRLAALHHRPQVFGGHHDAAPPERLGHAPDDRVRERRVVQQPGRAFGPAGAAQAHGP